MKKKLFLIMAFMAVIGASCSKEEKNTSTDVLNKHLEKGELEGYSLFVPTKEQVEEVKALENATFNSKTEENRV